MEPPNYLEDTLKFIIGSRKSEKRIKDTARSMLNRFDEDDVVCRLNKALYGLRQAGRAWHARLDNKRKIGAVPSAADLCIYRMSTENVRVLVVVYVDDILIMSSKRKTTNMIKEHLGSKFEVKELGEASRCLDIDVTKLDEEFNINQRDYIFDILERFGMSDCKPTITPGVRTQTI